MDYFDYIAIKEDPNVLIRSNKKSEAVDEDN